METIQTILTPETSQPKYSHSEKKEFEKFDEKTIIHELRDLWKKGASRGTIVSGLSFCNSEEAWDLREDVLSSAKDSSLDNKKIIASDMAVGLSGINNQRSWELRKKFLKDGVDPEYLAMSVMGIDSDEATEWRKKIRKEALNNNENFKSAVFRGLFKSLRGLGSLEANNFRKNLLENGGSLEDYILSFAGFKNKESENKINEAFSNAYFSNQQNLFNARLKSYIGKQGNFVKEIRNEFLHNKGRFNDLLESLATDDSSQADELRERGLKKFNEEKNLIDRERNSLAMSLGLSIAGVYNNQANKIREILEKEGFYDSVVYSFCGDDLSSILVKNKK